MIHMYLSFPLAVLGLSLALLLPVYPVSAQVIDGNRIMDQPMRENLCALTFDDGPSRYTGQLLDMLAEYDIPATFFVLGRQAEYHPDLVRRMLDEGHEVGSHSYSHPNLRLIPQQHKAEELRRTDTILRKLGANPRLMRPPYGAYDRYTVQVAQSLGMSLALWSVDSRDWRALPVDYSRLYHTRGAVYEPGQLRGVFLFHDIYKRTVDDLPRIVSHLRAGGCQRFVTMSQYLESDLDLEPGLMMTRRSHPGQTAALPQEATWEQTPPISEVAAHAVTPSGTGYRAWPAGSGPMPLARSSRPWERPLAPTLYRSGRLPAKQPG